MIMIMMITMESLFSFFIFSLSFIDYPSIHPYPFLSVVVAVGWSIQFNSTAIIFSEWFSDFYHHHHYHFNRLLWFSFTFSIYHRMNEWKWKMKIFSFSPPFLFAVFYHIIILKWRKEMKWMATDSVLVYFIFFVSSFWMMAMIHSKCLWWWWYGMVDEWNEMETNGGERERERVKGVHDNRVNIISFFCTWQPYHHHHSNFNIQTYIHGAIVCLWMCNKFFSQIIFKDKASTVFVCLFVSKCGHNVHRFVFCFSLIVC